MQKQSAGPCAVLCRAARARGGAANGAGPTCKGAGVQARDSGTPAAAMLRIKRPVPTKWGPARQQAGGRGLGEKPARRRSDWDLQQITNWMAVLRATRRWLQDGQSSFLDTTHVIRPVRESGIRPPIAKRPCPSLPHCDQKPGPAEIYLTKSAVIQLIWQRTIRRQ